MLIYLIDLTHESPLGLGSDTMPFQLGLIGAYCKKELGDSVQIQIFKYAQEFAQAMRDRRPAIVAASNYLWNLDLGYQYAQRIKKEFPEIATVFGGPNYPTEPDEQVEWLKTYPSVDVYVCRDGEIPFAALAKCLEENKGDIAAVQRALLPSCHSLVEGKPSMGSLAPRITDLTIIPSPYTTGLMDKFFEEKLIPTIQTNRGCPFTCTFCTEGGNYYTKVYRTSFERKKEEIGYIVQKTKHTKTLRITDSNFGMYKEDVEFCEFLNGIQKTTGYPDYVACSAGKNQKERILKCNELLSGAMRLTASVQSLDSEVLQNIKRSNISLEELVTLSERVGDTDTHSYSEIILALPMDTLEKEQKSMEGLVQAGIGNITQHQLSLIYGTELSTTSSRARYGLTTKYRPIQRCIGIYPWDADQFPAIEIEEICIANNTMTFEDYLESRRLYFTVGLFYNDRIFGEINALLRFLRLSTWDWLKRIHSDANKKPSVERLYNEFMEETKGELWDDRERLIKDITVDIKRYANGEAGGNLIYKYRARGLLECFGDIHALAFDHLKEYLTQKDQYDRVLFETVKALSWHSKRDLLNLKLDTELNLDFDVIEMISNPSLRQEQEQATQSYKPTKVRITRTPQQIESIERQLTFYGSDVGGMTMLMSRFPIRRLYRKATRIQ